MFLENNTINKKNSDKILIGYDLGDCVSQISYCYFDAEEPLTVPTVTGTQQYNIPTVLLKRQDVNQWFYGKEALKNNMGEEGFLLDMLVTKAKSGEDIVVDGISYNPVALLTLFMKRSLSLLSMTVPMDKVEAVLITVDNLDYRMIEVLTESVANLSLKTKNIHFQSHVESFFHYVVHQPRELWNHQVVACDFSGEILKTYRLEMNRHTTPIVAFIDSEVHGNVRRDVYNADIKTAVEMDQQFLQAATEFCYERIITTVYLIGEGFQGDWAENSIKYLCNTRRVFAGNNLYSKGACYGLREKYDTADIGNGYVFLGDEKLKANLGMKVLRRGDASYYAIMDAGINWYDGKKELDFMLNTGKTVTLMSTPLNGKNPKEFIITLTGLPDRPEKTTRIRLTMDMKSESVAHVILKDLGFGEIIRSSGMQWEEEFEVL